MSRQLLSDLARATAIFQQRAILAHLGAPPSRCKACDRALHDCGCHDLVAAGVVPAEVRI